MHIICTIVHCTSFRRMKMFDLKKIHMRGIYNLDKVKDNTVNRLNIIIGLVVIDR